ncbi:hypothetical protein CONLIGDRAFT_668829 [Coniochaeta ligniaria NRRL 30616]|uniref:Uncharacterized protein n=1 Tax=Coniochaeta ligniaria NRRL 30616 TaxID=1408157 RepID=A0A1J7JCB4_9PEZI|nr:hypothetical protein CONLIGDRAFT_668829 [Coniochaeta ligniaria NRRL 30616]
MDGAKSLGEYLVLDEAHAIKNTTSQTYEAIKVLRTRCNTCVIRLRFSFSYKNPELLRQGRDVNQQPSLPCVRNRNMSAPTTLGFRSAAFGHGLMRGVHVMKAHEENTGVPLASSLQQFRAKVDDAVHASAEQSQLFKLAQSEFVKLQLCLEDLRSQIETCRWKIEYPDMGKDGLVPSAGPYQILHLYCQLLDQGRHSQAPRVSVSS